MKLIQLFGKKKINENYKSNLISPISLISINNYIITTSGNGNINAFDFDGNLIWSKNFYMTIKTPSFILNDLVLILLNDGNLIALNHSDGSIEWNFNKEYEKIPSYYGGKFYNYRNNLFVVSPKNNLLFIDNLLYKYSDLEKNFFEIFEPFNQDNFDYDINVYTHNDNLIIIENNKFYSLYDMFTNEIKILRNKLPSNKYINILNNSIFLLNNKNEIILINSITSNTF